MIATAEKIHDGELIEFNPNNITAFNEFDSQLKELAQINNKAVFDYESSKGNQEARSHIHKLRKTKAAVEKARKLAKQNALEYGRAVDSRAKELSAEIEGMIAVHLAPIEEIEQREEKRKAEIQKRLDGLKIYEQIAPFTRSDELRDFLAAVESFDIDDSLGEFKSEAETLKRFAVKALSERIEKQVAYEAEQAELEKLRREKAEREERDRIERIQREATEKARKDENDRAEAKAKQERQEAENRRIREVAIEREERERLERKIAEKEEKERLEKAEQKSREDDAKHKRKIKREAKESLISCGLNEPQAKLAVTAIAAGSVKNLSINY